LAKKTRRRNLYIPSMKSLARKACPPGMIETKGFVRKFSTRVRQQGYTVRRNGKTFKAYPKSSRVSVNPRCIKNTGSLKSGIPASIGPLRKGELAKHGYSFKKTKIGRHRALNNAVGEFGALGVFRKLDAVQKLTVHTAPEASEIFRKDKIWIMDKFGPLKAPALV